MSSCAACLLMLSIYCQLYMPGWRPIYRSISFRTLSLLPRAWSGLFHSVCYACTCRGVLLRAQFFLEQPIVAAMVTPPSCQTASPCATALHYIAFSTAYAVHQKHWALRTHLMHLLHLHPHCPQGRVDFRDEPLQLHTAFYWACATISTIGWVKHLVSNDGAKLPIVHTPCRVRSMCA